MKMTTVCATAFILLVPVKLAQADDLGCNYSSLVGKEFVFREPLKPFKKPGVFGNKNTYLGWYSAPSDRSDHIGYEEHVGKKGKIQELPVPDIQTRIGMSLLLRAVKRFTREALSSRCHTLRVLRISTLQKPTNKQSRWLARSSGRM